MFQAQRQPITQCRLLVLNCFLTREGFIEMYRDIAAKGILSVIHGFKCVSYVIIGVISINQHSKFIAFAYSQYFAFLKQFTKVMQALGCLKRIKS